MPIIKSAIKRARQTITRRQNNLVVKHAVKKDVRAVMDALESGDAKVTQTALRDAVSEIDRAVKKGTLHKNTAARKKSRLSKQVNKALASDSQIKPPVKKTTTKAAAKKTAIATKKKAIAKKLSKK